MRNKWMLYQEDQDRKTLVIDVPGGTIYMVYEKGDLGAIIYQQAVFVPNPPIKPKSTHPG